MKKFITFAQLTALLLNASCQGKAIALDSIDAYTAAPPLSILDSQSNNFTQIYPIISQKKITVKVEEVAIPEFLALPQKPDTDTPALNAGVLPLSIDPQTKKVMVLLGFEQRFGGKGSYYTYTDFGGKIDPGETKKEAAVREGNEETAFAFKRHITEDTVVELVTRIDSTNYAFYAAPVPYTPIETIRKKATEERKKPGNHVEKSDYIWVELSELLDRAYNSSKRLDFEGKRHNANLYGIFLATLRAANADGYLTRLVTATEK
jgi:ADP-ribose pyrophosphatase YjhB (NUDIX family)